MLGLQPISAFGFSAFDPNLEDPVIVKIKDNLVEVDREWLWVVVVTPYQPGENIVFVDDDVQVEISWIQLEVPA